MQEERLMIRYGRPMQISFPDEVGRRIVALISANPLSSATFIDVRQIKCRPTGAKNNE
jgi:hypothetical protein